MGKEVTATDTNAPVLTREEMIRTLEDIRDGFVPDIHQHNNVLDEQGLSEITEAATSIRDLADQCISSLGASGEAAKMRTAEEWTGHWEQEVSPHFKGKEDYLNFLRAVHADALAARDDPEPRPLREVRKEFDQFWVYQGFLSGWLLLVKRPGESEDGWIDLDGRPAIGIPKPSVKPGAT